MVQPNEGSADDLADAVRGRPEFIKRSMQRGALLETRATAAILKQLGQAEAGTKLRQFNRDRHDSNLLRLPQLFDIWPNWPIYLVAAQVTYLHETPFVDMLSSRLPQTKLIRTYLAALDRVDGDWLTEERPCGLIFEVLHTKLGALWLAHTDTRRGSPRCVLRRVTSEIPELAIEPLKDYLDGIRSLL